MKTIQLPKLTTEEYLHFVSFKETHQYKSWKSMLSDLIDTHNQIHKTQTNPINKTFDETQPTNDNQPTNNTRIKILDNPLALQETDPNTPPPIQ